MRKLQSMVLRGSAVPSETPVTPCASEDAKHPSNSEGVRGVTGESEDHPVTRFRIPSPGDWQPVARNVQSPVGNPRHLRCTYCGKEETAGGWETSRQLLGWYDEFTSIHAHLPEGRTSVSRALYELHQAGQAAISQLVSQEERVSPHAALAVARSLLEEVRRMALRIDAQVDAVAEEAGVR